MAGPGGGPPRRSHTKSRKGCETCKRRHIRCDENFPQCRNCTKHKIRCPYNDVPPTEDRSTTPDKPDLIWTPEIRAAIEQWQQTGIFPFPGLNIYPAPAPQNYSVEELRLIYHVASICNELAMADANNFTLWTRQIPTIIKIGASYPFVMHSLFAFSAMHMAWLTDCPQVGHLSYEYRGVAIKGLHEAIGAFSRENSDAVLAASLVLSWHATDWRGWTQLMQGTSTVIEAMEPWKHESQFGDFIAESSTFPTAPPSPSPDHKPSQPRQDDLEAYDKTMQQLQKVEQYLKATKGDFKAIQQLMTFLKGARKVSPTLSVSSQFERLQPLRTWLFWLPVRLLQRSTSPASLVIIAHYYTVALLMERLFPEIGASYFGSLSVTPVSCIAKSLMAYHVNDSQGQTPLTLMEFPINTVTEFCARMGLVQPPRTQSFPQFDPPNFFLSDPAANPVPEPYLPYNAAFSYSTESLHLLSTDSAPNSAVSPLALSPAFAHANPQYLSIPSPCYGSAYSPASSTFEGSAYSDTEEYVPYELNPLSAGPGGFGTGSSSYGAGFVSPIQTQTQTTVWT